jgi:hypothetical protein
VKRAHLSALISLGATITAAQPCLSARVAKWGVGLYLAGESDLWQTARCVAERVEELADESVGVVVLLDGPPGEEAKAVLRVAGGGEDKAGAFWGRVNTGDAATLQRFSGACRSSLRATRWLLILLGHGEPPASGSGVWRFAPLSGGLAVDWGSGGDALTPRELEDGLGGQRWDVVVALACHSASAEYVWALRGTARWVVGSPSLLTASGRGVVDLVRRLVASKGQLLAGEVAEEAMRAVAADAQAGKALQAVVMVDVRRMEEVAARLAEVVRWLLSEGAGGVTAVEVARMSLEGWGPGGEMVDVASLGERLAEVLPDGGAREAARKLREAAEAAVPNRQWVCRSAGEMTGKAGLSLFLPPPLAEPGVEYEVEAPFARQTGWAKFLEVMRKFAVSGWEGPKAQTR